MLSPDPASARQARDVVRRAVEGEAVGGRVLDTALLLTSELVVDAALHTGGEVVLEVDLDAQVLRVSVSEVPSAQPADPQQDERRGLDLVQDLAARWGVDTTGRARTAWFELPFVSRVE